MKKLILSIVLLAAVSTGVKAQQDPAYSMYMFNGLFLNPAYAGSSEAISVMAIYRHQWAGALLGRRWPLPRRRQPVPAQAYRAGGQRA